MAASTLARLRYPVLLLLLSCFTVSCKAQSACTMDIVFILDASGSVGTLNFNKTLKFVKTVVEGLVVGPFDTQVGMIRFQTSPSILFHLNTFNNKQDVLNAVTSTIYTGGGTDTAAALQYATDFSFTVANGTRTQAAQVAVVLTDGQSSTNVTGEARRLRDKGVTVFGVGVGSGFDDGEVKDIASDPDDTHVLNVDDFDALNQILTVLQEGACQAEAAYLCGGLADIVFLLDESGSVGPTNFKKMLGFVSDVAEAFIVGLSDVRIGLSTFSTGYTPRFSLSSVTNKASLENLLLLQVYSGGQTKTDIAINSLRQNAFTPSSGHRADVPKIAVVITDGKSDDKTKTAIEAQRAQEAGIIMLVIGIGHSTDDAELNAIATDPDALNVHRASTFDALKGLENYVAAKTCAAIDAPTTGTTPCGPQADLVFLVDTSGSVGPENFRLLLNFINSFVKGLQIGQDNIRIGMVKFGSRPYKEFDLNQFDNKQDLMDAISAIEYLSGGTDTAGAIQYMDSVMFKAASGNRPGIPDIAVVITDGKSNQPLDTQAAAQQARSHGITIFSVGVGKSISVDELNTIASDPNNTHVLTVSEFTKLNAIRAAFKIQTCKAIPQNLTNTTTVIPTPPPPVDLCQDLIPNCAAYPTGVCNTFLLWSTLFCPKTCGICKPNFPVVPPPCEDFNSNCSARGINVCTGSTTSWAEQNCRKYCGYCGTGYATTGFFNKCYYKGGEYSQGERWQDGCSYDCECTDASTGQFVCYNKCPSYYNLPAQCPLLRQQDQCCLKPVCNFDGVYNSTNSSAGSGVCVYNGQKYNQGQIWSDGCEKQCFCLNAATGSYVCQSLCARYDWLPEKCKMEKRPGDCCALPRCEFDSTVGVITGVGSTSGPGSANDTNSTNNTRPGVCVYKGTAYNQDDSWYDGCDRSCVCDNAKFGFWRCQKRCPDFTNLPVNCSMVTVLGQCCKSIYCKTSTNFISSNTMPSTTGSYPEPRLPNVVLDYPMLPPNETYADGQDPSPDPTQPTDAVPPSPPVPPPQLSCPSLVEGDTAFLRCTADVSACQNPFLFDWSFNSRDLSSCTPSNCGGPYVLRDGVNVTVDSKGSTVIVQNVTRESPYANFPWTCKFCGGSQVVCDKIDVYVPPESPSCTVSEEFETLTGNIKRVKVNCSTTQVYPEAKCHLYRMVNGGQPIPITTSPSYMHIPDNETSVNYFRSWCSVSVSVQELGSGIHSFKVNIYPDVFDGLSVARTVLPQKTVELSLPHATHTCPPNLLDDYLCGKANVCNCSLVHQGYPKGKPVWYSGDVPQKHAVDGALVISYDSRDPLIDFTCEAVSALGRTFGSSLKFATEIDCN